MTVLMRGHAAKISSIPSFYCGRSRTTYVPFVVVQIIITQMLDFCHSKAFHFI